MAWRGTAGGCMVAVTGLVVELGDENCECGEADELDMEAVMPLVAADMGNDIRCVGIVAMVLDF